MKQEYLSLKNIYRFLFINDYPVYSEGVIKRNNHIGLTLTKFWQDNLLIDFRKHKYGKIIWRTEGGRNRYISEICNRSERLRFYEEYAEEILAEANPENVYRQIRQFMNFLQERQFSYSTFVNKISVYIKMFAKQDDAFSKEAEVFFVNAIKKQTKDSYILDIQQAFICGWIITFLMFHALAGNGEGEEVLRKLRNDESLRPENLGKKYLRFEDSTREKVEFLTGRNTEVCSTPLAAGHFFGREEELFELREMLENGGRYLISGIGGIGKTELMRQFLKCCEEEVLTDYICVVQYENNIVDSLIKAFPQIRGRNRDGNFNEALAIIRMHASERVLMIIDNMNNDCEEDEDIAILNKIPSTIFVTSRYQNINGFLTYRVRSINKEAGSLIFRDNYKMKLEEEDKQALSEILDNKLWCHTLTLRLLGRISAGRGWSLSSMFELLKRNISPVDLKKQDGCESLKHIYRQMYVVLGLPESENRLLQMFSILPYASYTLDFVKLFLGEYVKSSVEMQGCLEELWERGFLEKREKGYSIHPFIAECVRPNAYAEKDIALFLEKVIALWEKNGRQLKVAEYWHLDLADVYTGANQMLWDATLLVWEHVRKTF